MTSEKKAENSERGAFWHKGRRFSSMSDYFEWENRTADEEMRAAMQAWREQRKVSSHV